MSTTTATEVPLQFIPHAAPQGNQIPPPSPTTTQPRAVEANVVDGAAFLRVIVQHLFGHPMLHLLPVSRAASRGEVIVQVVRLHKEQTCSLIRHLEAVFVKNVIEVVPISNVSSRQVPPGP